MENFVDEDEARLREDPTLREKLDTTPDGRASRFLKSNMQYKPASFDAVLLWDALDYLDPGHDQANGRVRDGVVASGRDRPGHVSQQKGRSVSALSRGGFKHPAGRSCHESHTIL